MISANDFCALLLSLNIVPKHSKEKKNGLGRKKKECGRERKRVSMFVCVYFDVGLCVFWKESMRVNNVT